jgi:hypothetical protein
MNEAPLLFFRAQLFFLSCFLGSTTALFSQTLPLKEQEKIPPPVSPYIEILPLPRAWVMTAVPKRTASPSIPLPNNLGLTPDNHFVKQVRVVQSKDLRQEIKTYTDDSTAESWICSGHLLFEEVNDKKVRLLPNFPVPATFFPELAWVDISNYQGIEKRDKKLCYVFSNKASASEAVPSNEPTIKPGTQAMQNLKSLTPKIILKAWIEIQTKFPVTLEDPTQIITYTTLPTPDPIKLPDRFSEVLKKYEDGVAAPTKHRMKF